MKMMLRLSVLSMMIAASLSAADTTSTSHAGAGQQPAANSSPVVQPPAKDPVAELVDKLNACMPARSGADVAEIAKQLVTK